MSELGTLVGGLDFGEGPRWHDGRLWYSDLYQRAVCAVTPDGDRETVLGDLPDQPSGLGWMPDGSLLVVLMEQRRVVRLHDGRLTDHADLSGVATGSCNDMVVDAHGNAYVGNFGFDFVEGAAPVDADLALVRADGTVEVAATGLAFPNGSVITPDGGTLIVGQTMGSCYDAFTIGTDATLSARRRWADVPGTSPDGCTLDADGGIWFADAQGRKVVRVVEGGEVTHEVATPMRTFACALGGDDGRTLFILCARSVRPEVARGSASGAIHTLRVDVPHAGRP